MNLLAVDTATEKLSIALAAGNDVWLFEADAGLRHSELVMETIDMLFKKASLLSRKSFQALYVWVGRDPLPGCA